MKTCRVCNVEKPLSDFYAHNSTSDGRRSECKVCHAEASNRYKDNNLDKRQRYARRTNWRRQIKDWQDWEERYEAATHCELCGKPFIDTRHKQLDHDHTTGLARGVICGHCNRALGQVNDSVEHLHQLIDYLEKHNGSNKP